jgi:hypothetical protein
MTETTGFPDDTGQAPAPAPRQFTAEELDAARAQLAAQGEDLAPASTASSEDLGLSAVAAGAEAQSVDAGELLAAIRGLQAKVDALEADKRAANAPDVVKYAQALSDHLAAKSAAHPVIQADADHTWGQLPNAQGHGGSGVLGAVGKLTADAEAAAESGKPGGLAAEVGKVENWVKAHARRFPHIDYSYVLDLAAEAAGAAAKLAA